MVSPEFDDDEIVDEVAACLFHHLVLFDIGEDSLLKGRTSVRVPVNYLHYTFFCVHYLLFSINRKKKLFKFTDWAHFHKTATSNLSFQMR